MVGKRGQIFDLVDFTAGAIVIGGGALIMLSYLNLGILFASAGLFVEAVKYFVKFGVR